MNNSIRYLSVLFSLIISAASVPNSSAEQIYCTKDDVLGQWTSYSIDLSVSDHVEYQETIEVTFLQTQDGSDQFVVSFSGTFSKAINPWVGQCIGDQYVITGKVGSHDNVHSVQAFRNELAPSTDQCSLERCESTCIADMRDECSISKKISDNRITFMFLPGHSSRSGNQEAIFPGVNTDCIDHDCNHPGEYHTHD